MSDKGQIVPLDMGRLPVLEGDTCGPSNGLNLVITHGWATDSVFTQNFKHMFPEYRITLIDLPGYGKNRSLDAYADDFYKTSLMLNASIPNGSILICWSLSSLYGIKACTLPDSNIKALINVCGTPRFPDEPGNRGFHKRYIDKLKASFNQHNFLRLLRLFYSIQGKSSGGERIIECFNNFSVPSFKVLEAGIRHMMQCDERSDLKKLSQPSLHIFGSNDLLVPKEQLENIEKLDKKGIIIDGASHLPFITHPEIFKEIINVFLLKNNLLSVEGKI